MKKGKVEIIKNTKALGLSIEQIQQLTNLSKEEIEKIWWQDGRHTTNGFTQTVVLPV